MTISPLMQQTKKLIGETLEGAYLDGADIDKVSYGDADSTLSCFLTLEDGSQFEVTLVVDSITTVQP